MKLGIETLHEITIDISPKSREDSERMDSECQRTGVHETRKNK